jgi:hypothetical protein
MKTMFLLFLVSIVFMGCSATLIGVKSDYQNKPFEIYSDKSQDEVWNKILELFSTKGISIRLIDKSSGLIISDKTSFTGYSTVEDDNGIPKNPSAFVVCDKAHYTINTYEPYLVTGEWNIRVASKNDKTLININLLNIQCKYRDMSVFIATGKEIDILGSGKSTGVFEKTIADYIK